MHLDVLVRAGAGVAEDGRVDRHAAGALHVAPETGEEEKVEPTRLSRTLL